MWFHVVSQQGEQDVKSQKYARPKSSTNTVSQAEIVGSSPRNKIFIGPLYGQRRTSEKMPKPNCCQPVVKDVVRSPEARTQVVKELGLLCRPVMYVYQQPGRQRQWPEKMVTDTARKEGVLRYQAKQGQSIKRQWTRRRIPMAKSTRGLNCTKPTKVSGGRTNTKAGGVSSRKPWYTYPSEKYESQLGWVFSIYGKTKNVPKHQPANCLVLYRNGIQI